MKTEIGVGMGFGVSGDFGDPRAGNHDAGRRCGMLVEGGEAGSVFRVGDGEVVGVDDEKLGFTRMAQTFGQGGLGGQGKREQEAE